MVRVWGAIVKLVDVVRRAKEGTVTEREIAAAARMLPDERGPRAYAWLYVIARSSATQYEQLVASYLDHEEDPMPARLALQTLCTFWGFADRYVDQLERFPGDVEWDHFGDVRLIAISASGEYLRENRFAAVRERGWARLTAEEESCGRDR